jgi:hypothetical protein
MNKREYYQKIEDQLLKAMSEIDDAVGLMNLQFHENHKQSDTALKAKAILKKLLNEKFDTCAFNRKLKNKV